MPNESPIYNPNTEEIMSRVPVTTWRDGTLLTTSNESIYLGAMYNKDADGYFRYGFSGAFPLSRLNATTDAILESNIQKLINDFGTTPGSIILDIIPLLTANLTIPANIYVVFYPGCYFNTSTTSIIVDILCTTNVKLQQFGGVGDGVLGVSGTDNTNALLRFNAWAKTKTGKVVTLNLGAGRVYRHKNPYFSFNILNLVVNGNGALLDNYTTAVPDFDRRSLITAAGMSKQKGMGDPRTNVDYYLINSVTTPGSVTVTLTTATNASNLVVENG